MGVKSLYYDILFCLCFKGRPITGASPGGKNEEGPSKLLFLHVFLMLSATV